MPTIGGYADMVQYGIKYYPDNGLEMGKKLVKNAWLLTQCILPIKKYI